MFKHDRFYQIILQERDENAIEQFPKSVKRFSDKNLRSKNKELEQNARFRNRAFCSK